MLLAAMVSALIVVADQLIDSWADGDLLAAWVVLWVVGFAAVALLAAPARGMALRLMGGFTHRVQHAAQRRADTRLMQLAQQDARVLSELQSAMSRQD
jgi:gas vesicle protein